MRFYRIKSKWEEGTPRGVLRLNEVLATSPEATVEIWRYLFGVDLVARVKSYRLDPSLFLMVEDARRLHVTINEGIWLRIVELAAALEARSFNDAEPAVLEVTDELFPHNAGRWRVGPEPARTDDDADVALDVADLASAYLGAFTFELLASREAGARAASGRACARDRALRNADPSVVPRGLLMNYRWWPARR